jgi:hypothetical protein
MKNILSEITQQEKNRILEMHKKSTKRFYLSEDITPNIDPKTADELQRISEFVRIFKGKRINFYLPEEFDLPLFQLECNNIMFSERGNHIFVTGVGYKTMADNDTRIGDVKLTYMCDGSNNFTLEVTKEDGSILQQLGRFFVDFVKNKYNDSWKRLMSYHAKIKNRNTQKTDKELATTISVDTDILLNKFPQPRVEGGTDADGKDMISYIQNYMCSYNKEGRAVQKAAFASTNNKTDQNVA